MALTACARVLVRCGTDEKTGEALSAGAVAERVAWCGTVKVHLSHIFAKLGITGRAELAAQVKSRGT